MNLPKGMKIEHILHDVSECLNLGCSCTGDCRFQWQRLLEEQDESPSFLWIHQKHRWQQTVLKIAFPFEQHCLRSTNTWQKREKKCTPWIPSEPPSQHSQTTTGWSENISHQGSKDVTSAWSHARHNWVKQLLIRFGKHPSSPHEDSIQLPLFFNISRLSHVEASQRKYDSSQHDSFCTRI